MRSAVGGRLLSGLRIALDVLTVRFAVALFAVDFFGVDFLLVDFPADAFFGAVLVVFLFDVFLVILFSPYLLLVIAILISLFCCFLKAAANAAVPLRAGHTSM
jgi:hypothetical protein